MTIHQAIAAPGCGNDSQDMHHALIGVIEALARIAAHTEPVGRPEAVSLDRALGRIPARPVRSRSMAPAFDNAAMDGYATATSAVTGAGPWVLPVVARLPAGQAVTTPVAGAVAARIFKGTPTRRHIVTKIAIRCRPGRCKLGPATMAGFDAQGCEIVRFEDVTHSARVGLLSLADGLMFLPSDADSQPAGALVEFQPFCQS